MIVIMVQGFFNLDKHSQVLIINMKVFVLRSLITLQLLDLRGRHR